MLQASSDTEVVVTLEQARARVDGILRESESAVAAVIGCFEKLAHECTGVLELAGEIIGCVEGESVHSMLPRVQALGAAAKDFIHERLQATSGVLEMVASEDRMLEQLAQLTRSQRSIARETQTLSVLTNIEVARLGTLGSGFEYLARQLDEFSRAVAQDTKELTAHTEERLQAIAETKKHLAAGLPRIQKEFARIESDLERALQVADCSQRELARAPEQFRSAVSEITGQISGVVTAVQGHDITRQQLEHVRDSLTEILRRIRADEESGEDSRPDSMIDTGLLIQDWQLRSIEQTVSGWLQQIGSCAENILRISASELRELGPAVLHQEKELSEQLARIDHLESECEADSAEVQGTFDSLNNLMQLVGEHVQRSHAVRDSLQLLTFNSIVEASHLGTQADAILEISQSIKRISNDWSSLTEKSAAARDEILRLVDDSRGNMRTFSDEGSESLRMAQEGTRQGLHNLRTAAASVAGLATQLEEATARLQTRSSAINDAHECLQACFSAIREIQEEMVFERERRGSNNSTTRSRSETDAAEAAFSMHYTTELEREVLRAALCDGPLPVSELNPGGNDVELF